MSTNHPAKTDSPESTDAAEVDVSDTAVPETDAPAADAPGNAAPKNAASGWKDDLSEGDVTVAASSGAIAEIRADTERRRTTSATGAGQGDDAVTVIKTWTPDDADEVSEPLDPGLGDDPTMAGSLDPGLGDDPTMAGSLDPGLGDDPTIAAIASLDPGLGDDPTIAAIASSELDLGDDPTTVASLDLGLGNDPTSLMSLPQQTSPSDAPVSQQRKSEPFAVDGRQSLTQGKSAPASTTSYWDRNEIEVATSKAAPSSRARVPRWFLIIAALAVVAAAVIVLLLLMLTSGGST